MANADTLARAGIAYPLAIEIARQMTAGAGSGDVNKLLALGLGMTHAIELAKQINAASFDGHKLAVAGFNTGIAKLIKDHSGL
jgi:hypothetical protein